MTSPDAVVRVREEIEAARAADSVDERDAHVRTAVGEAVGLRVQAGLQVADLEQQLTNVLAAPDEEAPYFLNQAEQLLDYLERDAGGESAAATGGGGR